MKFSSFCHSTKCRSDTLRLLQICGPVEWLIQVIKQLNRQKKKPISWNTRSRKDEQGRFPTWSVMTKLACPLLCCCRRMGSQLHSSSRIRDLCEHSNPVEKKDLAPSDCGFQVNKINKLPKHRRNVQVFGCGRWLPQFGQYRITWLWKCPHAIWQRLCWIIICFQLDGPQRGGGELLKEGRSEDNVRRIKERLHDVRVGVGIRRFLHMDDEKVVVENTSGEEHTFSKFTLALHSDIAIRNAAPWRMSNWWKTTNTRRNPISAELMRSSPRRISDATWPEIVVVLWCHFLQWRRPTRN